MEAIITGVISGVVTLIVCLINNCFQQSRTKKENDKTIALIDYKLTELTNRVNKHNNVIERMYNLEQQTAVQEEKIEVANHRIKNLETKAVR